ncbi:MULTISPECIES: hypothetical protein [unclassified Archaeoglobus]|jgi:hypothetical protein|uniref:hypothetical protein n=1 Tax=unclassified Archaeoglobus TaxID=2643606 RepID=UPI0025C0904D|nr:MULTISPECIES: hypothetical protein [unclassified Archaeoglobus]
MKPLQPESLLQKAELKAIVTLIILLTFLVSYAYLLKVAKIEVSIDTDTFKLLLQTLLTLLSVAVGGWLFKGREEK